MKKGKIITSKNCVEFSKDLKNSGDLNAQAAAWVTVINFCLQNDMPHYPSTKTGQERVIKFLENNLKKKKK